MAEKAHTELEDELLGEAVGQEVSEVSRKAGEEPGEEDCFGSADKHLHGADEARPADHTVM